MWKKSHENIEFLEFGDKEFSGIKKTQKKLKSFQKGNIKLRQITVEIITDMRITMSICIPTYNGEDTIAQTLDSIISQRISNFEIVLNDDNSFDSTVEVIKKYLKKYKFIKLFTNKSNIGMDQNFTKTVLQAKGKFIWLCGQDDIFEKGALKKFNEIIQKYKSLDFIYFNYRFWDDKFLKELKPPQLTIEQDLFFKILHHILKKLIMSLVFCQQL